MDIATSLGAVLDLRHLSYYRDSMLMPHCPFMEAYPVLLMIVLSVDVVCT